MTRQRWRNREPTDKLPLKNRNKLALVLFARELHLSGHCVYVANETDFAGLLRMLAYWA
jgi:hypothetical protein